MTEYRAIDKSKCIKIVIHYSDSKQNDCLKSCSHSDVGGTIQ